MSKIYIDFSCGSYIRFQNTIIKDPMTNIDLLKNILTQNNFEEVFCITGPGSFTGLRTCCAFLNGFFWKKNITIKVLNYKQVFENLLENNSLGVYFSEFKLPYCFFKFNNKIIDFIYTEQNKILLQNFIKQETKNFELLNKQTTIKQNFKLKTLLLENPNKKTDKENFIENEGFCFEIIDYNLVEFFRNNKIEKTREVLSYQLTVEKLLGL